MGKLEENPKVLQSLKKMPNERAVRERSLLEMASETQAARMLLSDKRSTCSDPCSDTPASVDCIKECMTTVSNNPSACLDISASGVSARVEPSVFGVPGQQVHLDLDMHVQNHCPQPIKDITFQVSVDRQCPSDHPFSSEEYALFYNANQNSADVSAFADAQNSTLAYCLRMKGLSTTVDSSALPIDLSVGILASGTDATTNLAVSSQEKILTILGGSPWTTNCDLHCPPATDTPSTPAMEIPSIVFVHGFKPSPGRRADGTGFDCENDYWKDAIQFLRERGIQDMRTVKFYNGDRNCQNGNGEGVYSSDLHDDLYRKPCADYHPGSEGIQWEGTNDESIYRLSCLFAQYLHHNFANRDVILVGHSLGGLIMRETIYQMQENAGKFPYPPTIGHVEKAITFNTPHNGTIVTTGNLNLIACGGCTQGTELTAGSALLSELYTSGRNPQSAEGFTEWTTIGSQCDLAVQPASSSVNMDASHAVVYAGPNILETCYSHTKARQDANTKQDAQYYYCDTSDPRTDPCGPPYLPKDNPKWHKTTTGLRGLSLLYDRIKDSYGKSGTSGTSDASTNRSPRLLALGVVASTYWALLAR